MKHVRPKFKGGISFKTDANIGHLDQKPEGIFPELNVGVPQKVVAISSNFTQKLCCNFSRTLRLSFTFLPDQSFLK